VRAVVQRVSQASVCISGVEKCAIGLGLMVLLGIAVDDTEEDAQWLSAKIAAMRIFADEEGLMNRDIVAAGGDVLVVSQFTLHASYKKGNRPSFLQAAKPDVAIPLYEQFLVLLNQKIPRPAATGVFGADMQVALVNDGPVTIVMDTKDRE
jgi:D-aminoacyl-tRNA deacylase